ncbi:DNA cytosine methyltransferase [Hymenobacter psychrotolerans]|uniref:DNA cytosine methyltransferase n=1 Tax=Hymenobacter psychrotolerans TaxID=344998 RepID=UPI0009324BB6
MKPLTHASLFTGLGAFDLAAEWLGWPTIFQVEQNSFCLNVLARHFPHAHRHPDIHTFDATPYAGTVDVLTGGFPCQSFSLAGKGAMDLTLWRQMLRCVVECSPAWVVAENVRGLLARSHGLVLEEICADLEAAGYSVFPPLLLPAAAADADHRRERLWLVAHARSQRQPQQHATPVPEEPDAGPVLLHSLVPAQPQLRPRYASLSEVLREANGLPEQLDPTTRNAALHALGNSIHPVVAFNLLRSIAYMYP